MTPRGFGARGDGFGGSDGTVIDNDDLLAEIKRVRETLPAGEVKTLLKRCSRRIDRLQKLMESIARVSAGRISTDAEDS